MMVGMFKHLILMLYDHGQVLSSLSDSNDYDKSC